MVQAPAPFARMALGGLLLLALALVLRVARRRRRLGSKLIRVCAEGAVDSRRPRRCA